MLYFIVVLCFNYATEFGVFLQLIFISIKYLHNLSKMYY